MSSAKVALLSFVTGMAVLGVVRVAGTEASMCYKEYKDGLCINRFIDEKRECKSPDGHMQAECADVPSNDPQGYMWAVRAPQDNETGHVGTNLWDEYGYALIKKCVVTGTAPNQHQTGMCETVGEQGFQCRGIREDTTKPTCTKVHYP